MGDLAGRLPISRHHARWFALCVWGCAVVLLLAFGCSEDGGEDETPTGVLITTAEPPGGTYNSTYPLSVTLSASRPAVIYYSTDGRTPGEGMANTTEGESPVTGINIVRDTVLKFYAVDQVGNQEMVRTEEYAIDNPPQTSAVPPGDSYPGPITVVLFASEDADTYFTLDGTTPLAGEAYRYLPGSEIEIGGAGWVTLKFFSVDRQGNSEAVRTERYRIDNRPPAVSVSPDPGRYLTSVSVTLLADEVATIYYTLDGSTPSAEYSDWVDQGGSTLTANTSTGLGLGEHTLIRYFAEDEVGNLSVPGEALYLVGPTPYTSADPRGGDYNYTLDVTLSAQTDAEAAAEIYYTVDNTSPDPEDPGDHYLPDSRIPVVAEGTTIIRFFAIDENGYREEERFEIYRIDTIPPSTRADPPGDVYYEPRQVSLASDEEATIYYSINGEDPEPGAANTFSAPSPITNIVVSTNLTLKFMGVDEMGNAEPVQTEVYHIYYRHREDFSGEENRDPENTTADWNTDAGVLSLERGGVPLLGSYDTGGESAGVLPVDEFAFLAEGAEGIRVFDVSYPEDPLLVSTVPEAGLLSGPVSLARSGRYIFAGGSGGLSVVDTGDPRYPEVVGGLELDSRGSGRSLAVSGDTLVLADGEMGLVSIDIGDPRLPQLVGTTGMNGLCRDVLPAGDFLYSAFSEDGLVVFGAAGPPVPPLPVLGSYPVTGAMSLARDGNLLLVGTQGGEISLISVTDPASPALWANLAPCTQPVSSIVIRGVLAYLACGSEGLVIVNVSSPDSPAIEGSHPDFGNLKRLYSDGSRILASDGTGGIKIIGASSLIGKPPLLSTRDFSEARGVTLYRSRAYVANGADGVVALDVGDPTGPELTSQVDTVQARMSRVYGNHLVLADGPGGLLIFDLIFPDTLGSPTGEIDTDFARHFAVAGDMIFLADGVGGVKIFHLGDPDTPPSSPLAQVELNDSRGVTVFGDTLFVADGESGLVVIDVSDPADPRVAATLDVSGIAQMTAVRGNHLYLAAGSAGVSVFDVSDPESPQFLESIDLLGNVQVTDVVIEGDYLFLVSDRGIEVVNNEYPGQPMFLRTIAGSGIQALAVKGDYGYMASGSEGFGIFQVARETSDYVSPGHARSLTIDKVEGMITRAEIRPSFRSDSSGDVGFQLSNNGGKTWEEFEPYRLQSFTSIGSDLRWRASLSTHDPTKTPVIEELVILYQIAR